MTVLKVIYANTANSDMLYAVRMSIPDPFFYIDFGDRSVVLLDHREIGVFEEKNKNPKISAVLLNPLIEESESISSDYPPTLRLALTVFRKYGLMEKLVEVPSSFPLDMADYLRANGANLSVRNPFFPKRAVKSDEEIRMIEGAISRTYAGYRKIEEILKESQIQADKIIYKNQVLTSELIKHEVDKVLLGSDMINTAGIIIASGNQASIPHHEGRGPIKPNEPIICDLFPVCRGTGYFADMTRTYVKGVASPEMKGIYKAVKESQDAGIKAVRPGITGRTVHDICAKVFLLAGYEVGDKGFIHGTGHGLGLDIHEPPRLAATNLELLVPGNVVTVEPGLYYKDKGSARIEDVVVVTETGCRNLTNYPKILEIN